MLCLKPLPNGKPPASSTLVHGHHWLSDKHSNSQQQPTGSYKQTSKSLPGASPPTNNENNGK